MDDRARIERRDQLPESAVECPSSTAPPVCGYAPVPATTASFDSRPPPSAASSTAARATARLLGRVSHKTRRERCPLPRARTGWDASLPSPAPPSAARVRHWHRCCCQRRRLRWLLRAARRRPPHAAPHRLRSSRPRPSVPVPASILASYSKPIVPASRKKDASRLFLATATARSLGARWAREMEAITQSAARSSTKGRGSATMKLADLLVKALEHEGVRYVWLPGRRELGWCQVRTSSIRLMRDAS